MDEASSPCVVKLSVFENSYTIELDVSDLEDDEVLEPLLWFRLGRLLHHCDPNFNVALHPRFRDLKPECELGFEAFEQVCVALEQMWAAYRRLCFDA